MKAHKRALGSLLLGLVGLGFASPASFAETKAVSVGGQTIPDVVDHNSRLNDYYRDDSILGDAKFVFGAKFADHSIRKSAKQVEALYLDLLKQQDQDYPIVRTRDLPTPFTTSIFSLQSPANFSQLEDFSQ
ncbi:MAG: hypothetical protein HC810_05170 [Acaryochloridaceae cyanobacterium RL_2_7]|nr:hypothetical protein [Acaryochloridaceae cyanobacterium RL_2_7]